MHIKIYAYRLTEKLIYASRPRPRRGNEFKYLIFVSNSKEKKLKKEELKTKLIVSLPLPLNSL